MGRIEVSQLSVHGTLRVGMALAPTHPGVKSMHISFKGMPTIDMRLTPHGAPVSDLPALFSPIKALLQDKLAMELVDPKRITVDLEAVCEDKRCVWACGGRLGPLPSRKPSAMPRGGPSHCPAAFGCAIDVCHSLTGLRCPLPQEREEGWPWRAAACFCALGRWNTRPPQDRRKGGFRPRQVSSHGEGDKERG